MKTLLIFDLDGTLLDTLADLRASVNFALKKFGFSERSMEQVRKSVGHGLKYLAATSLPDGTPEETVEAVLAELRSYYREHYHDKTRPYPGILPLLQKCKQAGYSMALVSNKPHPMVAQLHSLFFAHDISYYAGEKPGVARKPAPDAVFQAMAHFSAECHNAVYIGDSEVDVLTAKNAGLPCLCVTWGFRTEQELKTSCKEPLCLCPNPEALWAQICALQTHGDGLTDITHS